jgi:hypothetical protein
MYAEQASSKQNSLLDSFFLLIACFTYSLTLGMEAERSSETLANFYQATRRHFPEGRILH